MRRSIVVLTTLLVAIALSACADGQEVSNAADESVNGAAVRQESGVSESATVRAPDGDAFWELVFAVNDGDAATVRKLVDAGIDVNTKAPDDPTYTVIFDAVNHGHVDVLQILVGNYLPLYPSGRTSASMRPAEAQ